MNYYIVVDESRQAAVGMNDSVFEITALMDQSKHSHPASSVVTAKQTRPDTIEVSWNTTHDEGAVYQVFYTEREKCANASDACIMHTACGMELSGTSASDGAYEAYPPDAVASKSIESLHLDVEYYFNVAVMSTYGLKLAYAGTIGTPTFERIEAAESQQMITALSSSLGGLCVALVLAALAKKRFRRAAYKIKRGSGASKSANPSSSERKRYWNRVVEERRGKATKGSFNK